MTQARRARINGLVEARRPGPVGPKRRVRAAWPAGASKRIAEAWAAARLTSPSLRRRTLTPLLARAGGRFKEI